jgi:uroporphyrinogen decarboxylase
MATEDIASPVVSRAAYATSPRAGRFLRASQGLPVDCTPIWMMRQAGRSLPEYRKLRRRHNLLAIAGNPELCAEVTLMPLEVLEVDAAIMFADIMLPLAGLGIEFELVEDVGPRVAEPIRSMEQIQKMPVPSAVEAVPNTLEAIRLVRKELDGVVPLIGFSGAPFTLASYLIEGGPTREFSKTKAFMFGHPAGWHALMERLTYMVVDYLSAQVDAGVQAVQLFDSWIGALALRDVEEHVLPYTRQILDGIAHLGVPRILFGTNTALLLEAFSSLGPEVVGVDWRIPLDDAWDRVGHDRALQGNLDPGVLLGPPELVTQRAKDVLARAGGRPGHIFNLGHGVLPDTPLDNLKLLVDLVHTSTGG